MVVLLPRKVEGLSQLEAKLSAANLQKWLGSAKSEQVMVFLPKFKTTAMFDLTSTLGSRWAWRPPSIPGPRISPE